MSQDDIKNEWCLQQEQFDSYEKHSLYIKLISILVVTVSLTADAESYYFIILLLVLWLQDGIWNTFQSRIEARLLEIEKTLSINHANDQVHDQAKAQHETMAYQFNTQFQQNRSGIVALVKEYVGQSIRPTVAFPHCVLVLLYVLALLSA